MGKATRWFKSLIGIKRSDPPPSSTGATNSLSDPPQNKDTHKRRWNFVKSYREKSSRTSTSSLKLTQKQSLDSYATRTTNASGYVDNGTSTRTVDANKHAIEVAAATAAVAEAAVAAAQAAAAVVRLTSSGRCNNKSNVEGSVNGGSVNGGGLLLRHVFAAVTIQSHFRGYLARRALWALKGLVKLQALVRGHITRKTAVKDMRRMQAMLRAQARARAARYNSESPASSESSSQINNLGPPTPEKYELQDVRTVSGNRDHSPVLKRNSSRSNSRTNVNRDKTNLNSSYWSDPLMDGPTWVQRGHVSKHSWADDERADKILEVDTGTPKYPPRRRNLFESHHFASVSDQMSHSYTTSKESIGHQTVTSPEIKSLNPLKLSHDYEIGDDPFCTAENSPHFYSASSRCGSSRRGPFTPTKSDGSMSFMNGYSDCPSYMSYTESSRAKMRSLSAPKQRPGYERNSSTKRYSVHGFGDARTNHNTQKAAALHASFANKAYPGSGRLDRLGMPYRGSTQQLVYYSGYLN